MKFLASHESSTRGTFDFPIELYYVDKMHPRYEMPFHWHMEFELLSFYKYPLMQYVLTIILSLVWISLKGIFISVWYKVWYSSYKKCGTAPACKNK